MSDKIPLKKRLLTIYMTGSLILGLIVTTECMRSGDSAVDSFGAGIVVGVFWPAAIVVEGLTLAQISVLRLLGQYQPISTTSSLERI